MTAVGQQITVEKLLSRVAEYGGSDLHLTVGTAPVLRLDGKLVSLDDEPVVTPDLMQSALEQLLREEQRVVLEKEKSVITTYSLGTKARFKINAFYQRGFPSISLHYIRPLIQTIRELGLPQVVESLARFSSGLVLVAGPFGSGRSATIAALIDTINRERAEHILTIERPIEYLFVNNKSVIEQREVGLDALSFRQALESSLQEDVNVIMISELDSRDVLEMALKVAGSGRLVLSTMSTNTAMGTIEKILTSFPPAEQESVRVQLSETLQGIVAQALLPRVGGGRVAIAEVLTVTPPIRSVIRDGAVFQIQTILQTSREEGMIPLDRALADHVKAGDLQIEEALTHAVDPNSLKMLLQPSQIQ